MHLHPVLVCLGIVPVVFYLNGLFLKRIYSSFSSAMPWASRMHFSSLSGWLSAHCTSRPKLPVCRCLRRQAKEDSTRAKPRRQNFRGCQRSLRLAYTHLGL